MWVVHRGLIWSQAIDIAARGGSRGGAGTGRGRGRRGTYVLSVVCEKAAIDVCEGAREVQHSHLGRAQRRVYHKRLWASI